MAYIDVFESYVYAVFLFDSKFRVICHNIISYFFGFETEFNKYMSHHAVPANPTCN